VELLEMGPDVRKLGHYECALEGDVGTTAPFSFFSFPAAMRVRAALLHIVFFAMVYCQAQKQGGQTTIDHWKYGPK
jgi:hypothetical protein